MSKKLTSYKTSALFILFILLILFFLWNAPPIEGPPIPDDDEHSTIEGETSCIECHVFEELLKGTNYHPPKTECLECHLTTVTSASYP
jgi:hypothetical protein